MMNHNQQLYTLSILILLSIVGSCTGLGKKDYTDDCDHKQTYSPDETKRCDSQKGLECSTSLNECTCFFPGAYYQGGKCRSRGSPDHEKIEGFVVECVKNSFCNQTVNTCHCMPGHVSNEKGTACSSDLESGSSSINPNVFVKTFPIYILAMLLFALCIN